MSRASSFRLLVFAAIVLVAVSAAVATVSAMAQPGTDPALMRRYGGVLAPDCRDHLLPQLKVLGDTLVVQDRGQAVLTGRAGGAVRW